MLPIVLDLQREMCNYNSSFLTSFTSSESTFLTNARLEKSFNFLNGGDTWKALLATEPIFPGTGLR